MNLNKLHLLIHLNYEIKNSEAIYISKFFSELNGFVDSDFLKLEGNISEKAFSALIEINKNKNKYIEELKVIEEKLVKEQIGIINFHDEYYPENLKYISHPPSLLFYRGNKECLKNNNMIAIIGTRTPTQEGINLTTNLSALLSNNGFVIVSGLAVGIDATAHKSSINNDGSTIAVLPGSIGSSELYPKANRDLSEEIIEKNGLLISELSLGAPPSKKNIVARNRIQAGLSKIIIPTEFKEGSGTIHAINFGKKDQRLILIPNSKDYKSVPKSFIDNCDFTFDVMLEDILDIINVNINKNIFKKDKPTNLL
tara:strand:- start:94 stop:1026 length:933 start_codon:yes stop_codon:yes gene_type:complete